VDIIEESKLPAMRPDNTDAQQVFQLSLGVIRSLSLSEDCVAAMTRLQVTELMAAFFDNKTFSHEWPTVFETLTGLAMNSKEERKRMQGPLRMLERVLGIASSREREDQGLVTTGREPYAINALRLVEALLSRDNIRLRVMKETKAPVLIAAILDLENAELKGAACRILFRLCDTPVCRQDFKKQGLQDKICDAFCTAGSSYVRGATSMALSALVSVHDDGICARAAPVAIGLIRRSKPADTDDFKEVTLPGALMVTAALARRADVQEMVISAGLVPLLVALTGTDESTSLTKEHAAHILGSIALQPKHHRAMTNLLDTLPHLMCMAKYGPPSEKAAAARALQHLTSDGSDFRKLVAEYKHMSLEIYARNEQVWTGMSALSLLLKPNLPPKCWEHGAGIFRNMLGLEDIRVRVMRNYSSADSALNCLIDICDKGQIAAKLHAAAALGNFCNNEQRKVLVAAQGGIKPLIKMLGGEGVDAREGDGGVDMDYFTEARLCALRTLGLIAHDEVCLSVCVSVYSFALLADLLAVS
jgi:hypothetical protein